MLAIILAGGKGTRLKPFTATIPKPLLPLGDLPILEVVIRQLVNAGFKRIVLTLNHMAPLFGALIGNGQKWGVKIEYCIEEEPLGTAGSLSLVENPDDNFLVMNGDILTTLDYNQLMNYHKDKQSYGTIGAAVREQYIDFGVLDAGNDGKLLSYTEKPSTQYHVSMGINILKKECLSYIPKNQKFDMPDLMLKMKNDGKPVYCYPFDGYWQDIGRMDDFENASKDFSQNPEKFLRNT